MEQKFKLWQDSDVILSYFPSVRKTTDTAVVIFPGGGYNVLAPHEGEGYAQLVNTFGIDAFVVNYRINPNKFPLPLLDARRAIRYIRFNSEKFGISKSRLLVMGSSAGGHLAALTSTYLEKIDGEGVDEIDNEDFLPNAQILCYPVISSNEKIFHRGSYMSLLGDLFDRRDEFSPELLVRENTPKAFIWHTADDKSVNVENSYRYASALAKNKVPHELHIFPFGVHGSGLAQNDFYLSEWTSLLRRWLRLNDYIV